MPVDSVVRIVGRHELLAAVADCMRASKSSTVSETNDWSIAVPSVLLVNFSEPLWIRVVLRHRYRRNVADSYECGSYRTVPYLTKYDRCSVETTVATGDDFRSWRAVPTPPKIVVNKSRFNPLSVRWRFARQKAITRGRTGPLYYKLELNNQPVNYYYEAF